MSTTTGLWIKPSDTYPGDEEVIAVLTLEDGTEHEFVLNNGSTAAGLAYALFATLERMAKGPLPTPPFASPVQPLLATFPDFVRENGLGNNPSPQESADNPESPS